MSKVYFVTNGDDNHWGVLAVFSKKYKAERWMKTYIKYFGDNYMGIEEREFNPRFKRGRK